MRKSKSRGSSSPKRDRRAANRGEEFVAVVVVASGSDSGEQPKRRALPKSATERIEALRSAGINVDNLIAMKGANGGEYVASNHNGVFSILNDDDPIYNQIIQQGTVPNRRLFRRWVMAQMFHMLSATSYHSKELIGVTEMIHRLGYEYQWKMLLNELYAQAKMEKRDFSSFAERNRWFNSDVTVAMAEEYLTQLKKYVGALKERKCKGIPYKRIGGRDIFVEDLDYKLYNPISKAIDSIRRAKSIIQLHNAVKRFNEIRRKMSYDTPQSRAWIDAYKGSGAFFTMQNLIRFHGCVAYNDAGRRLNKAQSLTFIEQKANLYCNGGGWRLLAVLKKMLEDNDIDIKAKQAEWRKK